MNNHARTTTEQAYRAFKRQVIALAKCTRIPAPIEKDAAIWTALWCLPCGEARRSLTALASS